MKSRFFLLDGLTFRVLSQDPVIRHVYVGPLTMWHVFTGPSWAATCITWSEARSQSLTCLSQEATNTLLPSSDQQTSSTGPPMVFMDFGTVAPFCSTSQQRTVLSQLPAIRKFFCTVLGLNSSAETESSGGEATSKSFIRLVDCVAPNMIFCFRCRKMFVFILFRRRRRTYRLSVFSTRAEKYDQAVPETAMREPDDSLSILIELPYWRETKLISKSKKLSS